MFSRASKRALQIKIPRRSFTPVCRHISGVSARHTPLPAVTGQFKNKPTACSFSSSRTPAADLRDPIVAIPEPYRNIGLTPAQRNLIKSCVPALQSHGLDITKVFYKNMLNAHPSLRSIFNSASQENLAQPRALADAVFAYAAHVDDLAAILPAVELIASKHASLYVQPDQYAIVGEHLIAAIGEVLGDAVTPELADAWTAAYWQLAGILIKKEHGLYEQFQEWKDWRDFKIVDRVKESDEVVSFHLEPVGGGPLPAFRPGQFISIQIEVPELGHPQSRQYSLSDSPHDNYYRISIKREDGENAIDPTFKPGLVSSLMHDTKKVGDVVRVSAPHGVFFLDEHATSDVPLVLISGGVGLTPLTSMLNALAERNSTRPISWIHGGRSGSVRPFTEHIKSIANAHDNVKTTLFSNEVQPHEIQGVDFHFKGSVDLGVLDGDESLFLDNDAAQYYVCGPPHFMEYVRKTLSERGAHNSRIHTEKFGPGSI